MVEQAIDDQENDITIGNIRDLQFWMERNRDIFAHYLASVEMAPVWDSLTDAILSRWTFYPTPPENKKADKNTPVFLFFDGTAFHNFSALTSACLLLRDFFYCTISVWRKNFQFIK